jgi:hypothetical protein
VTEGGNARALSDANGEKGLGTQDNRHPIDWMDLVAGIRAGDEEAVLRLRNIFQGGIRYFLRRGLGEHKLQSRQTEVLSLVIKSIRETSIDTPNHLASHVLTVLQEYISVQITAKPCLALEKETYTNINNIGAIRHFLAKLAAVDRETLRRYYINNQASKSDEELTFTSSRFHAVRSTFRSAARPRGRRRR